MRVGVHKVSMNNPSDVSGLERLIDAGEVNPHRNRRRDRQDRRQWRRNDFTRGFATLSFSLALAKRLEISPEDVVKRIAFVWSGGTEGVLTPHATFFTARKHRRPAASASRSASQSPAISRPRRSARWLKFARSPLRSARAGRSRHLRSERRALRPGQGPVADAGGGRRRRSARRQAGYARSQRLEALCARRDRARRRPGAGRSRRSLVERRSDRAAHGSLLVGRQHLGGRRIAATAKFCCSAIRRARAAISESGTRCSAT